MSSNAPTKNKPFAPGWLVHWLRLGGALACGTVCLWASTTQTIAEQARIVIVEEAAATHQFEPRIETVRTMLRTAITNLTGRSTLQAAWQSLVSTSDVVGIKVYSGPGAVCGTRMAVVGAVVEGLLAAGVEPTNIIVWDKRARDLHTTGFKDLADSYGVAIAGAMDAGYDATVYYENPILGGLVWGDLEFGKSGDAVGRNSHVTKLLTERVTRIINITPLLNHNHVGVTGHLVSLSMGSTDNTARFELVPARLATAVPEIYALTVLSDRVVLNITDALICQYEGGQRGLLHYSTVLNQLWLSRDPVALDIVAVHEIERQRARAGAPPRKLDLTLYHNAALLELGVSDTNKIQIVRLR